MSHHKSRSWCMYTGRTDLHDLKWYGYMVKQRETKRIHVSDVKGRSSTKKLRTWKKSLRPKHSKRQEICMGYSYLEWHGIQEDGHVKRSRKATKWSVQLGSRWGLFAICKTSKYKQIRLVLLLVLPCTRTHTHSHDKNQRQKKNGSSKTCIWKENGCYKQSKNDVKILKH